MIEAGLIASRFLHYAALLVLFGGALFPLYALPAPSSRPVWFLARLRRTEIIAALVALVTGVAWLAFATAEMSGVADDALSLPAIWGVVRDIGFGQIWAGRLALSVAVLAVVLAQPPWSLCIVPLLAGALLASIAGTGHGPSPEGLLGALHAFLDGLHLLAAGLWLGALAPLSWTMGAALFEEKSRMDSAVATILLRFSRVGYLAVALLVGTGLVNGWFLVGSLPALTGTSYGRVLAIKIGLFFVMVLFAAANRYWIAPQLIGSQSLDRARWLLRLRRHILVEQALGLSVIGVVSLLGIMSPALA